MADIQDIRASKMAKRLLSRRGLDTARTDIRVHRGVLTLRGTISALPKTGITNVKEEVMLVIRGLRSREGIRDVSIDLTYQEPIR